MEHWQIPGLTDSSRTFIKAELLKAHALFYRTDTREPYGYWNSMRAAFDGIARILFDARILTVAILNNELRLFVLESAIAGGWYHTSEERREEIFPGHFGHPFEWQQIREYYPGLFAAEIAEWHSRLLQAEAELGQLETPPIEPPSAPVVIGNAERGAALLEFKQRGRAQGIKVTDEMVAKAAKPGRWNTRTMVTWWKRNDSRCKAAHDRLIRAVLAKDPKTLWPSN